MRMCMHSESSHISTFGCICPSLPAILEDFFHHKPALVAPFILWLEYLLCAHHLPSTSGNIPHCTCTHAPALSPAALPHWDMPIHPCFPLPGGIFHHKPALVASFILWLEYLLCAHHTHFPIFQLPVTHVDPLFCQPGPFTSCAPPRAPFCAPLDTPAPLRQPLDTLVLHLSWACHHYR